MKNFKPKNKVLWHFVGFLIGVVLGAGLIFQILFLSKVLPHGGF